MRASRSASIPWTARSSSAPPPPGANYLLSLKESTLDIAADWAGVPVLIPEHPSDLDSLYRAAEALGAQGRRFLLDPILEPIHFGFTESLLRYHAVRRRFPEAEMMMGIGNLTELTDADTTGITAVLMGVVSELEIGAVLTTEVSPHARTSVREADIARRIMWAARRDGNLPRRYHAGLMALKDESPFPTPARRSRGPRPRSGTRASASSSPARGSTSTTGTGAGSPPIPFELWPGLGVDDDASHAFYLGVELGRAQIAWQLGKRYLQDNELEWGAAVRGGGSGVIRETIVTTLGAGGAPYVAPMGGAHRGRPVRDRAVSSFPDDGQPVCATDRP